MNLPWDDVTITWLPCVYWFKIVIITVFILNSNNSYNNFTNHDLYSNFLLITSTCSEMPYTVNLIYRCYPTAIAYWVHTAWSTYHDTRLAPQCHAFLLVYVIYVTWADMGRGDLPKMYARARGCAAPEGECGHIRQITTAHVTVSLGQTVFFCGGGKKGLVYYH